jgi:hypothetical protein
MSLKARKLRFPEAGYIISVATSVMKLGAHELDVGCFLQILKQIDVSSCCFFIVATSFFFQWVS